LLIAARAIFQLSGIGVGSKLKGGVNPEKKFYFSYSGFRTTKEEKIASFQNPIPWGRCRYKEYTVSPNLYQYPNIVFMRGEGAKLMIM
jgi:hypothetical protein